MIIIHNISKKYSTIGWQRYEVKINDQVICKFDHFAPKGLVDCLKSAAKAVEESQK